MSFKRQEKEKIKSEKYIMATCYTKLGDKHYNPDDMKSLEDLVKKRKKAKSIKKADEIDGQINEVLAGGVKDAKNPDGSFTIDDIFEDRGRAAKNSPAKKKSVLERLAVKAFPLTLGDITPGDVYN